MMMPDLKHSFGHRRQAATHRSTPEFGALVAAVERAYEPSKRLH
jgi:hypothetical protein